MRNPNLWGTVARYTTALVLVAGAAALRSGMPDILADTPFLAFYPAVILAAIFGGLGPGLLAALATTLCMDVLFIPPAGHLHLLSVVDVARQVIFLAGSLAISLVADRKRRLRIRERRQAAELAELAELTDLGQLVVHDTQGRIIRWSQGAARLYGYSAEQAHGNLLPDLLQTQFPEPLAAIWKKLHAAGRWEGELIHCRADGALVTVASVWVLRPGTRQQPAVVLQTNNDITAQKGAERALLDNRQRLAGIIGSAMDAIITVDQDQRIILFNPAAERMFRCPASAALGSLIDRFIPERFRAAHRGHIGKYAQTGETSRAMGRLGEISGLRADGEEFPIEASISQVRIGERSMLSVILRDATERQAIVAQLHQAKVEAEEANKAKDEFLAVLSHELRNPLTPVLAAAALLAQNRQFDGDTHDTLEMIRRNAQLEARLIDDLLDITRIARGKVVLDKHPLELDTVLRRAVEVCQPDVAARQVHFGVDAPDGPYLVHGDAARLQQVFWNLLKNAIKFTPSGGCVGMRCRRQTNGTGAGYVVVEVNDSGVGIKPEALSRIFNAFDQGERGVTRQFGGLGLGLTISKTMVELHGGTIEAQSAGKGCGASFRVRLPLSNRPTPPQRHNGPDNSPVTRALRILLVEDHHDTARIMARLLAGQGHNVQIAEDVSTALKLASAQTFDLLISDLGLPDGSGMDLVRTLRTNGSRLPAITLSGYGQEDDIKQSRSAGFNAHLTKPVDLHALETTIAKVMNGDRAASETSA